MRKRIKHCVLCVAFVGVTGGVQAQFLQNHPPEPTMSTEDSSTPNCGEGDGGSGGTGIPPPVGLCLPINDYLPALLLLGIGFGSYTIWKIGKGSAKEISAIE